MDDDEKQDEAPAEGPAVTVPTPDGPVTAPVEAAMHWDRRVWRRSCW